MCYRPANAATAVKCIECGAFNKPDNEVCQKCGVDLEESKSAAASGGPSVGGPAVGAPGAPGRPNVGAPGRPGPGAPGAPKPAAPAPKAPAAAAPKPANS